MRRIVSIALAALLGTPIGSVAQTFRNDRVDLHGFGGWSYGRTDGNRFLGADRGGEYTKANFALKIGAAVHPTIQISAQINWRNAFDGSETSLDYAFADWQISRAFGLRAGKVKHPFGIYSEVAGIGTVRPFLNLPQAVYGPVGIVSKSYRGIGLHGSSAMGGAWMVNVDVYGGGIEFEQEESALEILGEQPTDSTLGTNPLASRDVVGARVVLETAIPGFTVGASAYSGRREGVENAERYGVLGGQIEYLTDRIWLRSEFAGEGNRFEEMDVGVTALYVELAAFVTDRVQPALQYNRLSVRLNESLFDAPVSADLKRHVEWAVGLNYWVEPELGFKASWHAVEGNVISSLRSDDFARMLYTGISPHPSTRLVQLGVQFSF